MKVWVTRPCSSEVYMGGYRSVMVWLEKPSYDGRPWHMDGEWYDVKAGKYLESLHYEHGWVSDRAGCTYAKPFFKQCPVLFDKVWDQVARSCHPKDAPEDFKWELLGNYSTLLDDSWWEAKCKVNRKLFLLEVDLITKDVQLVMPRMYNGEKSWVPENYDLDPKLAICLGYLNEDLNRPYHPTEIHPYPDRHYQDIDYRRDRRF